MGKIFGIKRFEIHDGDGIRTTLFLKGCPLRCRWCHNPEGLGHETQLAWNREKCTGCGVCTAFCAARTMQDGLPVYNPQMCSHCGRCVQACPYGALTMYGEEVSAEEILPRLLEDRDFFEASGGGVTLSGGEPMAQSAFAGEVFALLKQQGIHTALDTSGLAPWEAYELLLDNVDLVLFDVKAADEDVHIRCTGVSNRLILENLRKIDAAGKTLDVRIPFIPGMNEDQIGKIGEILRPLSSLRNVKVLGYHNFAETKYENLRMEYPARDVRVPEPETVRAAVMRLREMGLNAVDAGGDVPG